MNPYFADLHIHSRFSRATSRELTPERLDLWARLKGIRVLGTGDITHPGWLRELQEKLEPDGEGLFRLKPEFRLAEELSRFSWTERTPVSFLLSGEISTIYKKAGRVRKVHQLLFVPGWTEAEALRRRLAGLGANLDSDGRPILGLDSRDLLEMGLEATAGSLFFVPAHIWTPWFSVLGEGSAFSTIEECFGDLSGHIHAVETGLSSDPPMNRLCAFLDRFKLISNSDAHSPEKIGREATILAGEHSYEAIVSALRDGGGADYGGTVEFFPEEGKYHYDGHRRCGVRLHPRETALENGLCPECGKPVTVGVLSRVMRLAGRRDGNEAPGGAPFHSLIPLREILAEVLRVGPGSKRVGETHDALLRKLGPELEILLDMPEDRIRTAAGDEVAEAVRRMRARQVRMEEGYDGEYGRIRLFAENELGRPPGQKELLTIAARPEKPAENPKKRRPEKSPVSASGEPPPVPEAATVAVEDPDQRRAIGHRRGPALVIAGPGSGKTRVMTERIRQLVQSGTAAPKTVLAVTFTRKAAGEMSRRLKRQLSETDAKKVRLFTFHAFGLELMRRYQGDGPDSGFVLLDEDERQLLIGRAAEDAKVRPVDLAGFVSECKQRLLLPESTDPGPLQRGYARYEEALQRNRACDLDDLVLRACQTLEADEAWRGALRREIGWVLVDECQDMNEAQYRLLTLLQPPPEGNLFLVGDPDQAIYGFRGADVSLLERFRQQYQAEVIRLTRSFRCPDTVLRASGRVVHPGEERRLTGYSSGVKIDLVRCASGRSEAEFIARTIEEMIGGLRFFSFDSGMTDGHEGTAPVTLADFAVLARLGEQLRDIEEACANHAIPVQVAEDPPFFRRDPARRLIRLLRRAFPTAGRIGWGGIAGKAADIPEPRWTEIVEALNACPKRTERLQLLAGACTSEAERASADYRRLLDMAEEFVGSDEEFLQFATQARGADAHRSGLETVSLLTLHAAKGLEFPCVFVAGCEEGLLPYALFPNRTAAPAEERRLLYVGMTRAQRRLFLTHADRRRLYGRDWELPRSPFLDTIEEEWLHRFHQEAKPRFDVPVQRRLFE
jgi:DNA helicase II / ATP-dependent DNA helicase PcrA